MSKMDISRNGGEVVFRTAFSAEHDLLQVLCGLSSVEGRNSPVDFRLAALQRKGHPDIWHADQVLAFCTDECSPMVINGEDNGGNHGQPCGISINAPAHGKTVGDVGSLWMDDAGLIFTLLRVVSADTLLFLSENIGPSVTQYAFAKAVTGTLRMVEGALHPDAIVPQRQRGGMQLSPAIRHVQREALCLKDGCWREISGYDEGCDRAEIREVYEIINPATVAQAIREGRPAGGYTMQPSLAAGEAMFLHRMTYRIEPDGTILCDFDHQLLQEVQMPYYLGIMHQVKCDLYGGGVWRYIPKVKPFEAQGKQVDFTRPFLTNEETLPDYVPLTPDTWTNPASPPDRQIDWIRRADGTMAVGFAAGFLPVHDGAPEVRAGNITDACTIVKSCKTYPTFAGGLRAKGNFPTLRGIAYKKYFLPTGEGASLYTVPDGRDTYVYMDFYSDEPQGLRYTKSPEQQLTLLEATASWQQSDECIAAQGGAGYACFKLSDLQQKG